MPGGTPDNTPQIDLQSAPEHVNTLRDEKICQVCGSSVDGTSCSQCGYTPPPESLDNPDLGKARENVHQNITPHSPEAAGIQNPQQRALENPPPKEVQPFPPNFQANSSIIDDMNWEFYHPKLGMGKINPIEKPLEPNGAPATNQPRKEKVISNPQAPVTSNTTSTAASMIAAVEQKENEMSTKLADTARGDDAGSAPSAAKPDANVDVTGVGAVLDGSNEAASAADAQIETVGVGQTPVHGVEADEHQSLEGDAGFDGAGFNTDKTTDDSGPTKTWTINYGDGSDVLTQHEPVTSEPFPASDEGVKQSSQQRVALDAEQFPHKEDGGFGGGSANQGTQPADSVGNAQDRVNVLDASTTPSNNSGPTKTWSGTDGNGVLRQQEPVTKDEFPPASEGVKSSSMITSHVVKAMKLADLEIELGLANGADKYNRLSVLGSTDERIIDARLETLSQVKDAGLRRAPKTASTLPSFRLASMASNETSSEVTVPDEALFL